MDHRILSMSYPFTPRLALLAVQVVTNDIKQAYLQTEVEEKHRNFLLFLWLTL